jgi:uncharacterized membrane protein HdeD (DUF308 family)
MILAGLAAIALPSVAGITVTLIVGWMLIISGVLHLVYAWSGRSAGAVIGEILIAILYGAIGVYILARPGVGLASLTVVLAIYLIARGLLELYLAVRLRPITGSGWLMVSGLLAIALAIMIYMAWPSAALWVVGTLVGISLIFSGITRLAMSMAVRQALPA